MGFEATEKFLRNRFETRQSNFKAGINGVTLAIALREHGVGYEQISLAFLTAENMRRKAFEENLAQDPLKKLRETMRGQARTTVDQLIVEEVVDDAEAKRKIWIEAIDEARARADQKGLPDMPLNKLTSSSNYDVSFKRPTDVVHGAWAMDIDETPRFVRFKGLSGVRVEGQLLKPTAAFTRRTLETLEVARGYSQAQKIFESGTLNVEPIQTSIPGIVLDARHTYQSYSGGLSFAISVEAIGRSANQSL